MCFLYRKKMREVMVWVVIVFGASVLNEISIGAPVTSATTSSISGMKHWQRLAVVVRPMVVHVPKKEKDNAKSLATAGSATNSSGSIGSTNGASAHESRVRARNESLSNDSVGGVVDSMVRMLNESLGSSPADADMSERGVRGIVKEVSSSMKELGRNLKKMVKLGEADSFKMLSRNESMIVVGVGGMSIGKSRSYSEKVSTDGKHVVVAVKGRDRDGRDKTREIRIKIGGKYDVESEKVYLVGDDGDTKWGTRVMIPLIEKKKKIKKKCKEKDGGNGIEEDLCLCEKMKDGKAQRGDVECVSGIVKELIKVSKDDMKVDRESKKCRKKKGMQNVYECLVKMLKKMDNKDGYLNKSHGRSMLSWSGWMEGEGGEVEDDEEALEGGEEGGRNKMMYVGFVMMLILIIVCLNDLKGQCGRYRQARGKAYEVVRLPEYAQTIYSRMIH